MNNTLEAALRRAAALTRDGSLGEATRAIQEALGGQPAARPRRTGEPGTGGTVPSPKILDLTANPTSDHSPSSGPAHPAGASKVRKDPSARSDRHARPLAETIRGLAAGRSAFAGLNPGLNQSVRPAGPPPIPQGAQWLSRDFSCPAGRRSYKLYVPASAAGGAKGVVVMLHGCKQNPDDFATGTAMNEKAEATGMIVLYPAQTTAANPSACWNWFSPADQRRDGGEPAILAGMARSVAEEFAVPARSVFVAGLSAGGAMAAILAETYPDVFSAAGIHSGLPVGAADDMASAFAAMAGKRRSGGHTRPGAEANRLADIASARLIVFHGAADTVVHSSNGDAIIASARHRTASVDRRGGLTDGGRRFERVVYRSADGAADVEHWILQGHGHAWSGGRSAGSYTDPAGPDASAEMIRFFQERGPR